MTREDIVRLWDEANNWGVPIRSGLVDELERFAALVAASAKAEEREACAKVCDAIDVEYEGEDVLATWCAAAIRERGEK